MGAEILCDIYPRDDAGRRANATTVLQHNYGVDLQIAIHVESRAIPIQVCRDGSEAEALSVRIPTRHFDRHGSGIR
jgi:hypothetical protein